jgi:hypothetical protein
MVYFLYNSEVVMASSYEYAFPALDADTIKRMDPSQPSTTIDADATMQSIRTMNQDNLVQSINLADSSSQNMLAYGQLLSRNNTIANLTDDLTMQNQMLGGKSVRDTYTRQGQINEWQAQNKLDTLFFLQILFLFFVVTVLMLYLRRYQILPAVSFYILESVALLIVLGVLWSRSTYTARSRDNRFWNRRYFTMGDYATTNTKIKCTTQTTTS